MRHILREAPAVNFHKAISTVFLTAMTTGAAMAEVPMELNNFYPMTQETIWLTDRAFFTQDNRGHFEPVQGNFTEGPTRCIGSGFFFADGQNTVNGICIFGEGDNTFTMAWKAGEKGEANNWTIIDGTGDYKGMTGKGIATTAIEVMYKAMPMRQTHIIGTVDFPAK